MIDFLGPTRRVGKDSGIILFVFPHPDDDVFAGGALSLLVRADLTVHAAWMTSGGYDGLDQTREDELSRAMDIAGVMRRHLLRLPDGGLIGALEEACAAVHRLVDAINPEVVISPAFEGGHADHDATSFAVAEGCRRAGLEIPLFEYPCYAPDADIPNGLRLAAFPAGSEGVRHVELDEAAMQCKEAMAEAHATQKQVFDLLGWRPATRESYRECPRDRDHTCPPYAGLDGYAHWFNWRSRDRFEHLSAAVASVTTLKRRDPKLASEKGATFARRA